MSVPSSGEELEIQRDVARIALASIADAGFALAGSSAIREHGLIDRLSNDVDLFTVVRDPEAFARALDRVIADLGRTGYDVELVRRAPEFARLVATAPEGFAVEVDFAVDWRAEDPVSLEIGAVLAIADAVGNKVAALYSRGEPRDYLDVDAIRRSGRFTDAALLEEAAQRDPGFDLQEFARQLAGVSRISIVDVRPYGIDEAELAGVRQRCEAWAHDLRQQLGIDNRAIESTTRQPGPAHPPISPPPDPGPASGPGLGL